MVAQLVERPSKDLGSCCNSTDVSLNPVGKKRTVWEIEEKVLFNLLLIGKYLIFFNLSLEAGLQL